MRKTLTIAALLALLAIPMIAFAGQASSPTLTGNGTPEPEGDPIACPEGSVTLEESQWVCRWVDTSYEETETADKVCPRGYEPSRIHDDKCVKGPIWDLEYTDYVCPDGFEDVEGVCSKTVFVEDGYWDCHWTEPECARPTPTATPEPSEGPSLRIGGRCTEGGDSQEIGYVFDDGDFDDARLIITRQDGVEVANEGEGSGFFPARAAGYSWRIVWFDGEKRVELDAGRFEVEKCELPTPTPPPGDCSTQGDKICPSDPPEHPPTGGEIDAGLAVVTALSGLALTGIGGSILYVKRRASR